MADQDDGYITTTTADVYIPERWLPEVWDVLYQSMVMRNLVRYYEVPPGTDVIHLPQMKKLVAEAITEGTALVGAQNTELKYDITINQQYGVPVTISDRVLTQNILGDGLKREYIRRAGEAIAYQIDQHLLGLYSGLSQTVNCYSTGTTAGHITDAYIRKAIQYLDEAGAPENDRHLVICPLEKNTLLGIDKFSLASNYGDGSVVQKGAWGEIYGVKVWVTNAVATSTTRKNLMFHRDFAGLAVQVPLKIAELYQPLKVATDVVVSALYGYSELRDAFGVTLATKATA